MVDMNVSARDKHTLNILARQLPSSKLCHHPVMVSDDLTVRQRRSVPEKAGLRHLVQRCDGVSPHGRNDPFKSTSTGNMKVERYLSSLLSRILLTRYQGYNNLYSLVIPSLAQCSQDSMLTRHWLVRHVME